MRIGGLLKSSLIEYPGMISAIIFTQGCNFRCPYCHNPELVDPERYHDPINEEEVLSFLKSRRNVLDAVVVSGGEPTIYPDLPDLFEKIKDIGYLTKLDTNGTSPEMLSLLIERKLIDYIAMDIKAPIEKYDELTNVCFDITRIKESIELLRKSEIETEFRTTVLETIHTEDDIVKIGKMVPAGKKFFVQRFEPNKTLDESYMQKAAPQLISLNRLKERFEQYSLNIAIR